MVLPWRRGGRVGRRRDLFHAPLFRGAFYCGLRISDCGIIVLRFVRCQWSVVRSSKNKGRGKKGNLLLLHAPCSMPYATLLTPET